MVVSPGGREVAHGWWPPLVRVRTRAPVFFQGIPNGGVEECASAPAIYGGRVRRPAVELALGRGPPGLRASRPEW